MNYHIEKVPSRGEPPTMGMSSTAMEHPFDSAHWQPGLYTSERSATPGMFHIPDSTEAKPSQLQVGGKHYKDMKIQPVVYNHANNLPFIEGSIVKYISRWREKGGIQDLRKIQHFVDLLIELEEAYEAVKR